MRNFEKWFQTNYGYLASVPFLFHVLSKHDEQFYLCNATQDGFWFDDVLDIAMHLLNERYDDGMYDDMNKRKLEAVTRALKKNDGWAALGILFDRMGYEYEAFAITSFDTIGE